jgi:hypothetical protein
MATQHATRFLAVLMAHACIVVSGGTAVAHPVVYTLRTVTDGAIGTHAFHEALVTVRLVSDTRDVRTESNARGDVIFTNRDGKATITIVDAGRTIVATFAPGEIYARYDLTSGIAGFGSNIGPTYPLALDCQQYVGPDTSTYSQDCQQGSWFYDLVAVDGTVEALAAPSGGLYTVSAATVALPKSLARSTLLTGRIHACAGLYGFDSDGDLLACATAAAHGLATNRGGLYLQDEVGGISSVDWSYANVGSLQIEVLEHDESCRDDSGECR